MGHERVHMLMLVKDAKKLWDLWNLRGCLISSLLLQALLILFASFRKRCKNHFLHLFILSFYVLAEWIAAYALGQTVQTSSSDIDDPNKSGELYLFWAQFLLLHLSGPDNIISSSPGDNVLWLKQLLRLIFQVLATVLSFVLITVAKINELQIPTIIVFCVAIIKCLERVKALLNSSCDRFAEALLPKPDPGLDYEDAVAMYSSERVTSNVQVCEMALNGSTNKNKGYGNIGIPSYVEENNEIHWLLVADSFFKEFKLLFSGSFLSNEHRKASREYFLKCKSPKAFRLVEFELSFLHDLMHTKVTVLQNKFAHLCRSICWFSVLTAFVFFKKAEKKGYDEFDVKLTYYLLVGTIALDFISLIKLIFRSITRLPWMGHFIPSLILKRKHWSRSVFQSSMLKLCLYQSHTWGFYRLAGYIIGSTIIIDRMRLWFSSSVVVTHDLEEFIFDELKKKSKKNEGLEDAIEACKDRGFSVLFPHCLAYVKLEWSIREFQYLDSLLLWHLATDLCYHDHDLDKYRTNNKHAKFCKLLSDYMFYLLAMQPTMLSQDLGNWLVVFQDTQEEAKRFFKKYTISRHMEGCQKLISVGTKYRPGLVKRSKSKSLLFDACILSCQLGQVDNHWELMAQVWIELMCFAAINCSPAIHALQSSKGGELLTFTWLLMNHLGLGMQFSE
ncbi:hypothetical protein F8388_010317 [Cannabis sativa]|uniref:DUF4220 domain-containing protein n=1 Tax=Cannabis sativa TaxID=3483 RepID=A0A7J6HQD8_CANSA|nr:hypothetical protein F8388_010317 [Cannabis sativa]KAF4397486.1 hypothetical protein G4B88_027226 [Cannabis sativa]